MGRSYWFECPRCGYRAYVAGRADRGVSFAVQTILCRDCKELYDAVTRLKIADGAMGSGGLPAWQPSAVNSRLSKGTPPSFQAALNRLPRFGVNPARWLKFNLQCPVSPLHRVQPWNDPDRCPKCAVYLEKNALPYRIWE